MYCGVERIAARGVGVRVVWLSDTHARTPTVFQQGTFSPDNTTYRWLGSIAFNGSGAIGIGYSVSSTTVFPSIRIAGRLATDPLGTLAQGESVFFNGAGSQSSDRWGDYSQLTVDPTDDCTFWYVNEYLPNDGVFNYHTRIGKFTVSSCNTGTTPCSGICTNPIDFTISGSFQSGNLGTGASCYQTTSILHGGNCGNFVSPRSLSLNGATETAISRIGRRSHLPETEGTASRSPRAINRTRRSRHSKLEDGVGPVGHP